MGRKAFFSHNKTCKERLKQPHDKLGRIIKPGSLDALRKHAQSMKGKPGIGHKHTEESKKKISAGRLKALAEGRGNHWICPHIKRSYAEQYFYDCFSNLGIKFESNVWLCGRYCVDFLFGKYYFEVDGEQHYTDNAVKHDCDRKSFLFENGYICVGRCRWKEFIRLSKEQKESYIQGLVAQLAEANGSNPLQCEFESHPIH